MYNKTSFFSSMNDYTLSVNIAVPISVLAGVGI
jgi:hypothetical protein